VYCLRKNLTRLVDNLPVTHLHHRHGQKLICYLVYDAVRTLPNPVALLPGKLFTADRAGILPQFLHALKNTGNIFVWDWPKIF
jgi:hypothetical protein